jgi:hypothetical protein
MSDENPDTTADLRFLAYNIVNQLGDLWHEQIPSDKWVPVRQATNDEADEFVLRILNQAVSAERAKITAALSEGSLVEVIFHHGQDWVTDEHGAVCFCEEAWTFGHLARAVLALLPPAGLDGAAPEPMVADTVFTSEYVDALHADYAERIREADAKITAVRALADEMDARLPDGTGNGRAYNAYAVARMIRERLDGAAPEPE